MSTASAMRLCVMLLLVQSSAAADSRPRAVEGAPRPALRSRGRGQLLQGACRKLCTQPGLVAASGGAAQRSYAQRHVRGIVFGGMDGILTTFALLAAAEGAAQTSYSLTLVIGISTVLADALSMAAGEYLSAKAENELQPPDEGDPGPLEKGGAMFLAFTLFGSVPLIGYALSVALAVTKESASSFVISTSISACTLFALGAIKSQVRVRTTTHPRAPTTLATSRSRLLRSPSGSHASLLPLPPRVRSLVRACGGQRAWRWRGSGARPRRWRSGPRRSSTGSSTAAAEPPRCEGAEEWDVACA